MKNSLKTVILTAPPGWGKTTQAQALQAEFGCACVVDEWNPSKRITPGALHLTNMPPTEFRGNKPDQYTLVSRGWPQ